jgi:hypothetical protein
MTTKTDIKRIFNTQDVEQLGAKQLFIVGGNKLVSYTTTIGHLYNGQWYITDEKYSRTTTRHVSYFRQWTSRTCHIVLACDLHLFA